MLSLIASPRLSQSIRRVTAILCLFSLASVCFEAATATAAAPATAAQGTGDDKTADTMKAYTQKISDSDVTFEMVPIPAGKFKMGSPDSEADRGDDEGPVHEVEIAPFWMGKYEVTWDEYEIFMFQLDIARRKLDNREPNALDKLADACSKPTKPYTDMTFGMGKEKFPVICMTQYAMARYCDWISAKTGRYYRLPTEAEWEYACRAGTTTAYHFGDDPEKLGEYAWYYDNSDDKYHPVGQKKPNPWGLYDMHGNVAEFTLDQYDAEFYKNSPKKNPLNVAKTTEPCVVRGGSWDQDPEELRSADRVESTIDWKQQDPQIPQSIWYYTDATFVGFRIVRPLEVPDAAAKKTFAGGPPE
jgi:formylglycine-generating enzyme required for sulfatase activity